MKPMVETKGMVKYTRGSTEPADTTEENSGNYCRHGTSPGRNVNKIQADSLQLQFVIELMLHSLNLFFF